ncbi:MAG: hypothetical protein AAF682_05535 [Planctomycetota bacterium]
MTRSPLSALSVAAALFLTGLPSAQTGVSAVAVDPNDPGSVWVCNRDNGSVSVVDLAAGTATEVEVGVHPRSLAFAADGATVFVANQRGTVPIDVNFATPFTGAELRSSVSVIDVASRTVTDTLTDVGIEPYGLAVAPNGAFFAVSGFRSGTLRFFDAQAPYGVLHTHEFHRSLNEFPDPLTIDDVDSDGDFLADEGEPRAFAFAADSARVYVTHLTPGYVSVVDLTLDGTGRPVASSVSSKINLNEYPFHPILNPTPVQVIQSQGVPRFLQDVALSPDGSTAVVPHLLHNVNHDVGFDFGPALAGDFANRVYPALTLIDTASGTFERYHHELSDPAEPASYVPYGVGKIAAGAVVSLGGEGAPLLGGSATLRLSGPDLPGAIALAAFGQPLAGPVDIPFGAAGTLYLLPGTGGPFPMSPLGGGAHALTLPVDANPALAGVALPWQVALLEPGGAFHLSNGVQMVFGAEGTGAGKLGHRAGNPAFARFNAAGDRLLLLNRGSEDLFLYEIDGAGDLTLRTVYPPRFEHVERAPFDTTTSLGDLPLGMTVVDDPATANDDALVHVVNELTRTLSTLRVDWDTFVITKERDQVPLTGGPDALTASQRVGMELFEDASRAQTAGNFNNSCASCHFEGGADGNVWQRTSGPRSTMPVFGGAVGTGLQLWKGVRLHLGETGPMFPEENGGQVDFTTAERQGLIDFHEVIPVPLNPNLDPVTGQLTPLAAFGQDLFFGTDDTGLNPTGRNASCTTCHPRVQPPVSGSPGATAFFTRDTLPPQVVSTPDGVELFQPNCTGLQEPQFSLIHAKDVNTGVNIDVDPPDGIPDSDRNGDGYLDLEPYVPMYPDVADDFERDDPNSWPCPVDIGNPLGPKKTFERPAEVFSIPTKLGAFSTGPYFHDHSTQSLRALLDPASQTDDPKYGSPGRISVQKLFNEFHDVRGHEEFVPGISQNQQFLQSTDVDADIEAILAFVRSL